MTGTRGANSKQQMREIQGHKYENGMEVPNIGTVTQTPNLNTIGH